MNTKYILLVGVLALFGSAGASVSQRGASLLMGLGNAQSSLNSNLNRANAGFAGGSNTAMNLLGKGFMAYGNAQEKAIGAASKGLEAIRKPRTDFAKQKKILGRAMQSFFSSLEKLFGRLSELLSEEEDDDLTPRQRRKREAQRTQKLLGYSSGYDKAEGAFLAALNKFFLVIGGHLGDTSPSVVDPEQTFTDMSLNQLVEGGIDNALEPLAEKMQEGIGKLFDSLGSVLGEPLPDMSNLGFRERLLAEGKVLATEKLKLSQLLTPYQEVKIQLIATQGAVTALAHKVMYEPLFASLKKTHRKMKEAVGKRLSAFRSGKDGLVKFFSDKRIVAVKKIKDVSTYTGTELGRQKKALLAECRRFTKQKGKYLGGFAGVTRAIGLYLGQKPAVVAPPEGMMTDDPRDIVQRSDLATLISDKGKVFRDACNAYQVELNKIMASPIGAEPVAFVKQFVQSRADTYTPVLKALMRAHNNFLLVLSKATYGMTHSFVIAEIAAKEADVFDLMNQVFEVEASDESADESMDDSSDEYDDEYGDSYGDEEEEPEEPQKAAVAKVFSTDPGERLMLYKKSRKAFWGGCIDLLKLCDGAIGRKRLKKLEEEEELEFDADTYTTHRDEFRVHLSSLKDLATGTAGKFPVGRAKVDGYTEVKRELFASSRALHAICVGKLEALKAAAVPEEVIVKESFQKMGMVDEEGVVEESSGVESDEETVVIPVVKDTSASKLAEIEEAATLSAEEKNMSTADEAEMEEQQEEAATSALEEGESVSEQADDDEDLF